MTGGVDRPQILFFGIRGVAVSNAGSTGLELALGPGLRWVYFWCPKVSACCVNSLHSYVLCVGLLVLRILGTLVFLTWRFSFSLGDGLVVGCSVRRLLVLMFVHTAQFPISSVPVSEGIEIRQGCRFISRLVGALGTGKSYVQAWAFRVGAMCSWAYFHPDHWNFVIVNASVRFVGFRVSSRDSCGAFGWHFKAPLLHHFFCKQFPTWSLPRHGGWFGKRDGVTTSHLLDGSGNVIKRVWLTRKTCPGTPVHVKPEAMKKVASP